MFPINREIGIQREDALMACGDIRSTIGQCMLAMRKLPVVPICRNPSALPLLPNQRQISPRPASTTGAYASSRTLGGMRWTLRVREDERTCKRTVKACGTSAADLKFLLRLPRVCYRNFKSKAAVANQIC
jgi:hypothetical protein